MSITSKALIFFGGTVFWLSSLGALLSGGAREMPAHDPAQHLQAVTHSAATAIDQPKLAAYRGWIKFLLFEANSSADRSGAASEEARAKAQRLDDWLQRIAAQPDLLAMLDGVQEWAYESPVDGSGQPFKIAVPTDYNPSTPAPLTVYMHGSGGNHLEHSTAMVAHAGAFELSVLGRGRDGGFHALSEADVLQAIDYVVAHWAIDPNRIALRGGSMGGGGTYQLGSRFPHRWASGRPTCGFASNIPMGNLITLPIYATHSADDPVVSILHERGPLARLRDLGGQVIFDETNGYGHAVWNYKEGNDRATAWVRNKVRPDSRSVRHIDYTALDGVATRGWWAEINEWGNEPKQARFVLTAGEGNTLYAELSNISRLKLLLVDSPFDRSLPLNVSVQGAVPIVLPAPLPADAILARGSKGWEFESVPVPEPFCLHTPGSAGLLYDGEPLLIVYGTSGSVEARTAMHAAAIAASRSSNPSWPDNSGDHGPEGVPDSQNLYGALPVKADTEVTPEDLARCHLVLIGTTGENALVARMAERLPVRLNEREITCSDSTTFSGMNLSLGLVYYNPLSPQRLVFWIASNNPVTYAAGSILPRMMAGGLTFGANAFGADLLIMPAATTTVIAARSFDSRWRWLPGRDSSPLLDGALATSDGLSRKIGDAIRRATASDLSLVLKFAEAKGPPIAVGSTRVSDLIPFFANTPLGIMQLKGAELETMAHILATTPDSGLLLGGFEGMMVRPERTYRLCLPVDVLWKFSSVFKTAPNDYKISDVDTGQALERFLMN